MRYISKAIRNPQLVMNYFYAKHEGLILSVKITTYNQDQLEDNSLNFEISDHVEEIHSFYKRMGRIGSMKQDKISAFLSNKNECILVKHNEKVIGAMWILRGSLILDTMSAKILSLRDRIRLNEDTLYGAYVIIDEAYRGLKINQKLLNFILNHYALQTKDKKLLLITGISNGAYISSVMKFETNLIGIVRVLNFCGMKKRVELYMNEKEKLWR